MASVEAGGVLSGEHGIGLEKRDLMARLFSADDLDAQARLREAFDPDGVANPGKVLPAGSRCGELQTRPARGPVGVTVLDAFADEVGEPTPVRSSRSAAGRSSTSAARSTHRRA